MRLLGSHAPGCQGASGGAGPCPPHAHAHPGARVSGSSEANSRAQMRVSTKPDSSSLWLAQPGQRGPCRPGSQAPPRTEGGGASANMGEGWRPPPTISTRQRGRKQDGHRVGARQAKGQGPRPAVWPRDGRRTKPAPGAAVRPSGRRHGTRRVPACTCPCPAGPWTDVPAGRGQQDAAGGPARPSPTPSRAHPRLFTAWLQSA